MKAAQHFIKQDAVFFKFDKNIDQHLDVGHTGKIDVLQRKTLLAYEIVQHPGAHLVGGDTIVMRAKIGLKLHKPFGMTIFLIRHPNQSLGQIRFYQRMGSLAIRGFTVFFYFQGDIQYFLGCKHRGRPLRFGYKLLDIDDPGLRVSG